MKAYDIEKLTAKLKSSDSLQYRNKLYHFVACIGLVSWPSSAIYSTATNTVPSFIRSRQVPFIFEL